MNSGFLERLRQKWNVTSLGQVLVILLVFSFTGFSVMFLKKPITEWMDFQEGSSRTLFSILYWILIFPVYNILLLFYGFVFGQFNFFWEYEKKFFRRLLGKKKTVEG